MRYALLGVISLCALGACNAPPRDIYTADGRRGQVIDCSPKRENIGRALQAQSGPLVAGNMPAAMPPPQPDWGACLAQAGSLCGSRGYDVLERQPHGTMVIQCRGQ